MPGGGISKSCLTKRINAVAALIHFVLRNIRTFGVYYSIHSCSYSRRAQYQEADKAIVAKLLAHTVGHRPILSRKRLALDSLSNGDEDLLHHRTTIVTTVI